jgi:hypothetical protein
MKTNDRDSPNPGNLRFISVKTGPAPVGAAAVGGLEYPDHVVTEKWLRDRAPQKNRWNFGSYGSELVAGNMYRESRTEALI